MTKEQPASRATTARPHNVSTTGGFQHIVPPLASPHQVRLSTDQYDGAPVHQVLSARTQSVPLQRSNSTWDLDDYFVGYMVTSERTVLILFVTVLGIGGRIIAGPLDPAKHSKFPFFMRLHGSILPKLLLPIFFVAVWSTAIVLISEYVKPLSVDPLLLTALGFVVALALSFRSTTAYERYNEGRKYWALLTLHARQLAHVIWIYGKEREGELEKEDILAKVTVINLIYAFAQACKHRLRHEIEYDYLDLKPLIENLDSFAKMARVADPPASSHNKLRRNRTSWGEFLGISFLQKNPKKVYKVAAREGRQHGNLPYEIIGYIGRYIKNALEEGTFESAIMHGQVYNAMNNLMDAYGGCDRVLQTPLPLAYNIAISQITWLYVLVLPFQLYAKLGWVTVPGTIVAAYIILGIAAIGREIEDPFGADVNDLDLDRYCQSLQYDLNVMTSRPATTHPKEWITADNNKPLWPYSVSGYNSWKSRSVGEIRAALAGKVSHQASVVREELFKSGEREEKPKLSDV